MSNTVEIIIKTVTSAAKSDLDAFGKSFQKLTGYSFDAAGAINLLGDAVIKAGKYVVESVDQTQKYALAVRNLAQNLNIGTMETSRIIQVADDFGIEMGSVETALKMALKNGFAPTIETLAEMADRYNKIQDPTQRAAELTKVFGRNWAELTPLLRQGRDAILANAAAQSEALLITEAQAQAAEDLRQAQDALNDSQEAISRTLGNKLIPLESNYLDGLNKLIETGNIFAAGAEFWDGVLNKVDLTMTGVTDDTFLHVKALEQASAATNALTMSTESANAAMQNYTAQLLFNKAAANMTDEAALSLAYAMGLVDERTVYATEQLAILTNYYDLNKDGIIDATEASNGYNDSLARLNEKLQLLDGKVSVSTVIVNYEEHRNPDSGTNKRAAGGPVFPGQSYLVGEEGPEMLYMDSRGGGMVQPITNNHNNYNLTIHTAAQSENISADFAQMQALG